VVQANWQLFTLVFAAATGALGYWVRYRADRQKELVSKLTEEQRAIYKEFSNFMVGITQASQTTPWAMPVPPPARGSSWSSGRWVPSRSSSCPVVHHAVCPTP